MLVRFSDFAKVWCVKKVCLIVLLGCVLPAWGQQDTLTLDDVVQSAQDWAKENLDDDVLRVLQGVDPVKVRRLLDEIQKRFQGEYVLELGRLKDAARAILPVLEHHEETLPYAEWLKTRLDYLETADELRLIIPPPKPEQGKPPALLPNPQPDKEREVWIKKLSDRPWPDNAKACVAKIKPIFKAAGIPPELAWIAEVESSFDPTARSPAGAVGLFQLMPATARQYGLRTWPFDQRLETEASARAAAKYLDHLYDLFKDWRLSLAAYNAGEGTVQSLLKRNEARAYDAIATQLPAETQMYVPKVEATVLRREGLKLDDLPPPEPR